MRWSIVVLMLGACTQVPDQVRHPEPVVPLLRVIAACDSLASCVGRGGVLHLGPVVFAETDSLVIADRVTGRHVAVRADGGAIEVYRGQRVSGGSVLKQAGRNTAFGIATGAMAALAGAAVAKVVGFDVDAGELIKGSAVTGAMAGAIQGTVQGATEGEAVWERVTLLQLRQELCRCSHP